MAIEGSCARPLPYRPFGIANPVRGLLNGAAALGAMLGVGLLAGRSESRLATQLPLLVFSLSLVSLYTVSALYHSVPWSRTWKKRMKRVDHSMIYFTVAATYTPLVSIVLDGWPRALILLVVWGVTAVGIVEKTLSRTVSARLSIVLQTSLGWLGVVLVPLLATRLPSTPLLLIAAGGVLYTVGMLCFVLRRPVLWPRVFSYHEAFHVLVVMAGGIHFGAIYGWIAPL